MRFILLLTVCFSLAFTAYPKVFESHGKKVYAFMEVCQPLQELHGSLGKQCSFYYQKAQENLKAGFSIDSRRHTLKAGDPQIKNYIKSLKLLAKEQLLIKEGIDDLLKEAIRTKNAKLISKLFTLPQIRHSQRAFEKIAKLKLTLNQKAYKKLQNYLDATIPRHQLAVVKSEGIRVKKNETLKAYTCVQLSQMDAIASKQGMMKAIIAGKTHEGYVIEVLGGKHFFLMKSKLPRKYSLLERIAFEVKGKGRAEKVTYSYSDGIGRAVRKTETLPVVAYVTPLKKICEDRI